MLPLQSAVVFFQPLFALDEFFLKIVFFFLLYRWVYRSAGDTLTLEIYRKNGSKPSGCGGITSDQLNAAELHSGGILHHQQPQQQQQRQSNSPVNHAHSSSCTSTAAAAALGRVGQPPKAAGVCSVAAAISRRVVENASVRPASASSNGGSGHVWYPSSSNTSVLAAPLPATAAPLKVAFNKSIGGGVLV